MLYAAIGAGMLEAALAAQVDDTAARYVATMDPGWLTDHAAGLRAHLGLPAGRWTESAWTAALRGRGMARESEKNPSR